MKCLLGELNGGFIEDQLFDTQGINHRRPSSARCGNDESQKEGHQVNVLLTQNKELISAKGFSGHNIKDE